MNDTRKTKAQLIDELIELREYVTELETSETEQRGEKDAMRVSEEQYRSLTNDILDTSAVGVIFLDANLRIVWVNQALECYFGLYRNEIIGKDKRQLIRECIMGIFENPESFSGKVLATYGDNTYVENFECHVLPDEEREERWLEHWSQPIRSGLWAGGRIEHYTDITGRKRLENELRHHRDHLDELVSVRTAELSAANKQLNQEIAERKQAEAELTAKVKELEVLHQISIALSSKLDVEELLQFIVEQVANLFDAHSCSVLLPDEETGELVFQASADHIIGMRVPPGKGIVSRALRTNKMQIVNDVSADPDHYPKIGLVSGVKAVNLIAVPLCMDDNVAGVLEVLNKRGGDFTRHDSELVEIMVSHAAIAIEKAQLFASEQQQRVELEHTNRLIEALSRVNARIQSPLEINVILNTLGDELEALNIHCNVTMLSPKGNELILEYTSISSKFIALAEKATGIKVLGFRLPLKGTMSVERLSEIHFVDVSAMFDYISELIPAVPRQVLSRLARMIGASETTKIIHLPLMTEGAFAGGLTLWGTEIHADELPTFTVFANQVSIALENARLFEQVCAGRERLQILSHRLVEIQENERREIAFELHDEVGQNLTALKLSLDSALNVPADEETKAVMLQNAGELADEISKKVQDLSLDLRPSMLDDLGLLSTLIWHIDRFRSQTNIQVDFEHSGLGRRFNDTIELAAFRIVQEALTNVVRHADVERAFVRVWADHDEIHLQVEDHGVGFETEKVLASKETIGLLGMTERAILIGGSFDIISTPSVGTTVMAILPSEGRLERRTYGRQDIVGG